MRSSGLFSGLGAVFLYGCAGLWSPFLGEAPSDDGEVSSGDGGGTGADLGVPGSMTCTPVTTVRAADDTTVPLTRSLHGVWGFSDAALWAVGESGLILHSSGEGDGTVWRSERESGPDLLAVWGPDGFLVAAAAQAPSIFRRSPVGAWGPQPIPGVNFTKDITGIDTALQLTGGAGVVIRYRPAATPSPVLGLVFVRSFLYASDEAGNLLRYDQTGSATPAPRTSTEIIRRLKQSNTSGQFWAVGDAGLLAYWDGAALVNVNAGTKKNLTDVWQSPSGVVWLVGKDGTLLRCLPGSV